jgi:hypothetical protein
MTIRSHLVFDCLLSLFRSIPLIGLRCILLFAARAVHAVSVTLPWDPAIDDSTVASYEVHYGTASGQYQSVVQASGHGAATSKVTVAKLDAGKTYYFAIRSRNADSTSFSDFSNETSVTAPMTPTPGTPPIVNVNGRYAGTVGTEVALSSSGSSGSAGAIASYSWSFGDGATSTEANPSS